MNIKKQITVCKTETEIKIYPESKNELGLWIAHPPCFIISVNDLQNIENMMNEALQYSNSGVPVTNETTKNVLIGLNVKSWNTLYISRKIIIFSLSEKEIIITPFVYTKKGVFPDTEAKMSFDIGDYTHAIGLLLKL